MKNKLLTVTIGIPTLNSSSNIKRVIENVLNQKEEGFSLKKIIIFSDGSTDNTVEVVTSLKNKRIELIKSVHNRGFAYGVQKILSRMKTDVLVLINDDTTFTDNLALQRLTIPFLHKRAWLVCGKIIPLPVKTFIERAVLSSFIAYSNINDKVRNGNNFYTCDAKVLGISSEFAKKISLLDKNVGNVDLYLYFLCLSLGGTYQYVKERTIYFRLPQTAKDLYNQTSRANVSRDIVMSKFKDLYNSEAKEVQTRLRRSIIKEALKNPIGALVVYIVNRLGQYMYGTMNPKFKKWSLAGSTKEI